LQCLFKQIATHRSALAVSVVGIPSAQRE